MSSDRSGNARSSSARGSNGRGSNGRGRTGAGGRQDAVQPSRRVALEVIVAVRESDAFANLLLPSKIERARLSASDAALATELTYGTLRRLGFYDAIISEAARRPTDRIDPLVLDILRLGTHQLVGMRTAQHAAVDESVSLARIFGARSATGFVNGVLRTISRTPGEEWLARVSSGRTEDDRLAVEYSHPAWVVRALRQALASEGRQDELESLLEADNVPPRVSLAALPGLASANGFERAVPASWSPVGAVSSGGDPAKEPLVASGRARVQDEGSQLAALALAHVTTPRADELWLDLCAGPGGKAALLGAIAAESGAQLVANEVVPARAGLVRRALAALPTPVEVTEFDGRTVGTQHPGRYDRVLIDAPCTGLGALRRRPEARWRKQPRDVPPLARLQEELLASGIAATRSGGYVAYVTCSPHIAETRAVLDAVLRHHSEVTLVDAREVLAGITTEPLDLGESDGTVQLWPHRHGTDAMFISLLRVDRD